MKHLIILAAFIAAPTFANTAADKAVCEKKDPSVDRAACMLEQRNARAAMKDGSLETDAAALQKNQLARCDVFKSEHAKKSCVDRVMKGVKSGSVSQGGTITEHREVIKK